MFFDVKNGGGTVRTSITVEKKDSLNAQFATATVSPKDGPKIGPPKSAAKDAGPKTSEIESVKYDYPLHERGKAAVPTVHERTGLPMGEVAVTSVPDLVFLMHVDGRVWTATYSQ